MRLARELGMHMHELMGWQGPMTWRQFCCWREWLSNEVTVPSRSDFYSMQVAATLVQVNSKQGTKVDINDFRLKVKGGDRSQTPNVVDRSRGMDIDGESRLLESPWDEEESGQWNSRHDWGEDNGNGVDEGEGSEGSSASFSQEPSDWGGPPVVTAADVAQFNWRLRKGIMIAQQREADESSGKGNK